MTRTIGIVLALVLAAVVIGLSGCGGGGGAKAGGMKQAVDDYNARRYSEAKQQAVAIQDQSESGNREDAAYLAGLSAYQLGDVNEAERRLLTAAKSNNPETAAKAKAMLGQIRMDQRRPRDAAGYFADAHPDLAGDDAKKCAYNAAVAYQQAGDATAARRWAVESGQRVGAASVSGNRNAVASGAGKASFTLQVGAFREEARARQAAEEAEKLASREGLGAVRTLVRKDGKGETTYLVQFGSFATRAAAAAARTKIGKLQYIVAASG